MRSLVVVLFGLVAFAFAACGSSDDSGSGGGGGGGSGGTQATTCMDGYPTVGKPCAIANEKCVSCGSYACCDIFECENGLWAQTQKHTACPADAGSDATPDTPDDGAADAADDSAADALGAALAE